MNTPTIGYPGSEYNRNLMAAMPNIPVVTQTWIDRVAERCERAIEEMGQQRYDQFAGTYEESVAMQAVSLVRACTVRPGDLLWNMAQLCCRESWLCIYKTDLFYHDINYIRLHPEATRFLWLVDETHSWITRVRSSPDEDVPDEMERVGYFAFNQIGGSLALIDTETNSVREIEREVGLALIAPLVSTNPMEYHQWRITKR